MNRDDIYGLYPDEEERINNEIARRKIAQWRPHRGLRYSDETCTDNDCWCHGIRASNVIYD